MTNSDEGSPGRPTGHVCEAAWARAVVLSVRLSCSRTHGILLWSKCFLNIHRMVSLGSTLSENDSHSYLYK